MEQEIQQGLIEKYKLPENEHKVILDELKARIFLNKTSEQNPSIMFVIGQPGCGKTTFIKNTDVSNYTNINSDDYRDLNKHSDEILDKYPTYYTKFTNFDSHLWGDELFSYAIENGYSVLREKAPVDYSLLETIKAIPDEYNTIINLVVTGNLTSLLATRERYEQDILKSRNARLSNIEAHNKCYEVLPDFIKQCLSLEARVNYVVPTNNSFTTISVGNDYLNLLEKIRKESNDEASSSYVTRMNNIKRAMIARNAPQEQFDELEKIAKVYSEVARNKCFRNNGVEQLETER